jgi:hypothetical protein
MRFDLRLGQSGGEDTEFFYRLTDAGGRIAFAPEAWVDEPVPASRTSLAWLIRRRFRSGQTYGARLLAAGENRFTAAALAAAKSGFIFCIHVLVTSAWGAYYAAPEGYLQISCHQRVQSAILQARCAAAGKVGRDPRVGSVGVLRRGRNVAGQF